MRKISAHTAISTTTPPIAAAAITPGEGDLLSGAGEGGPGEDIVSVAVAVDEAVAEVTVDAVEPVEGACCTLSTQKYLRPHSQRTSIDEYATN